MTKVGGKHTAWSASLLVLSLITAGFGMLFPAEAAHAQEPGEVIESQTFESPDPVASERFGFSVAHLGDVNGDGVSDLAVGAPGNGAQNEQEPTDHAWILFMGQDGLPLTDPAPQRLPDVQPTCEFGGCWPGFIVEGIGDIDGDGIPDLATGIPQFRTAGFSHGGVAIRLLNEDGTVKQETFFENPRGTDNQDFFGMALANLGDIDGDPETATALAVLAPGEFLLPGGGASQEGLVWIVFLDTEGNVTRTLELTPTSGGEAIANVGDVNGDGVTDLALSDSESLSIIFLNSDGTGGGNFITGFASANSLASLGDLDDDGTPDLAVDNTLLFLNEDGTVKSSREFSDLAAQDLAGLGDLAGDGSFALAAGYPTDNANRGAMHVLFLESGRVPVAGPGEITYVDEDPDADAALTECTETHERVVERAIDFDQDGAPEFGVVTSCGPGFEQWMGVRLIESGNDRGLGVIGTDSEIEYFVGGVRERRTARFAMRLEGGTVVRPTSNFISEADFHSDVVDNPIPGVYGGGIAGRPISGPWKPDGLLLPPDFLTEFSRGYLGVKFELDGELHFGWIRVDRVLDASLLDPGGFGVSWFFTIKDYAYATNSRTGIETGDTGQPPDSDSTAPVCGPIDVERDEANRVTRVRTTATDEESGIAEVDFLRLANLLGFVNGYGPFDEDGVKEFDPGFATTVYIRGERIHFDEGGAIVARVVNGAGQFSDCDPVTTSLVAEAPEAFGLEPSHPNPFRSATTIPFRLAEPGHVTLTVYDVLGREVARLVDREMAAGAYEVQWTAPRLASGTYFYQVEAGDFRATRRMSIVR